MRTLRFPVLSLLLVVASLACGARAGEVDRARAWLRDEVLAPGHPGARLVVAVADEVPVDLSVGSADAAHRRPMQADGIFRIYSMTKPVVSAAVLRLVGQGHAGLDDPVALHLPELAQLRVLEDGRPRAPHTPPTVRHLLTHTAGFPVPGDGAAWEARDAQRLEESGSLAEYVRRAGRIPLARDPGSAFVYDSAATEILGRLVEVWSGQPLDRYLHETFFAPLGMADTGFQVPPQQRDRVVELTCLKDGVLVPADHAHAREPGIPLRPYPSAAGGLYSTAADYLAFARMLMAGGRAGDTVYVPGHLLRAMFQDQLAALSIRRPPTSSGRGSGFGLGLSVLLDPAAAGRLGPPGQAGWSGAAATYFVIDPERQRIGLLLLQHLSCDGQPALPSVSNSFYNLVQQLELP